MVHALSAAKSFKVAGEHHTLADLHAEGRQVFTFQKRGVKTYPHTAPPLSC
jgi:hypothetical protein